MAAVSAAAVASAAENENTLVVSAPPLIETVDENVVSALLDLKTINSSELPDDATTNWLSFPSLAALIAVMVAACSVAASILLPTVTSIAMEVWPLLNVVVITSPLSRLPVIESTSRSTVACSRAEEIS